MRVCVCALVRAASRACAEGEKTAGCSRRCAYCTVVDDVMGSHVASVCLAIMEHTCTSAPAPTTLTLMSASRIFFTVS